MSLEKNYAQVVKRFGAELSDQKILGAYVIKRESFPKEFEFKYDSQTHNFWISFLYSFPIESQNIEEHLRTFTAYNLINENLKRVTSSSHSTKTPKGLLYIYYANVEDEQDTSALERVFGALKETDKQGMDKFIYK